MHSKSTYAVQKTSTVFFGFSSMIGLPLVFICTIHIIIYVLVTLLGRNIPPRGCPSLLLVKCFISDLGSINVTKGGTQLPDGPWGEGWWLRITAKAGLVLADGALEAILILLQSRAPLDFAFY